MNYDWTAADLGFAFTLSLLAGLATGIGAAIAFFVKRTDTKMLTFSLGFSAGVMVYISFVELLQLSKETFVEAHGASPGSWYTIATFFGGMGAAALIDKLVPADENPHEYVSAEELKSSKISGEFSTANVKRSGTLFALAIAIHNFPEGIATLTTAMGSSSLGISVALAVAIHNIPEGIAVALPLYYGTGSRKKAFWYAFLSGLTEPVGAGLAILFLLPFLSATMMAVLFAAVAGIMVYISFDELLPMAERWGHHHLSIYGIIAGMLLMAVILA